jgi:hypothetical protein
MRPFRLSLFPSFILFFAAIDDVASGEDPAGLARQEQWTAVHIDATQQKKTITDLSLRRFIANLYKIKTPAMFEVFRDFARAPDPDVELLKKNGAKCAVKYYAAEAARQENNLEQKFNIVYELHELGTPETMKLATRLCCEIARQADDLAMCTMAANMTNDAPTIFYVAQMVCDIGIKKDAIRLYENAASLTDDILMKCKIAHKLHALGEPDQIFWFQEAIKQTRDPIIRRGMLHELCKTRDPEAMLLAMILSETAQSTSDPEMKIMAASDLRKIPTNDTMLLAVHLFREAAKNTPDLKRKCNIADDLARTPIPEATLKARAMLRKLARAQDIEVKDRVAHMLLFDSRLDEQLGVGLFKKVAQTYDLTMKSRLASKLYFSTNYPAAQELATDLCIELVQDTVDFKGKCHVIKMMFAGKNPRAKEWAIEWLKDTAQKETDPATKYYIADALVSSGDLWGKDLLIMAGEQTNDPEIKIMAACQLSMFRIPEANELAKNWLIEVGQRTSDPEIKIKAACRLSKFGILEANELAKSLLIEAGQQTNDPEIKIKAACGLSELGTLEANELAKSLLIEVGRQTNDSKIKIKAAYGLRNVKVPVPGKASGTRRVDPEANRLATDLLVEAAQQTRNPKIKYEVANNLRKLGTPAEMKQAINFYADIIQTADTLDCVYAVSHELLRFQDPEMERLGKFLEWRANQAWKAQIAQSTQPAQGQPAPAQGQPAQIDQDQSVRSRIACDLRRLARDL